MSPSKTSPLAEKNAREMALLAFQQQTLANAARTDLSSAETHVKGKASKAGTEVEATAGEQQSFRPPLKGDAHVPESSRRNTSVPKDNSKKQGPEPNADSARAGQGVVADASTGKHTDKTDKVQRGPGIRASSLDSHDRSATKRQPQEARSMFTQVSQKL